MFSNGFYSVHVNDFKWLIVQQDIYYYYLFELYTKFIIYFYEYAEKQIFILHYHFSENEVLFQ